MSTRLSLLLAGLIFAALLADAVLNGGTGALFAVRKLFDLVEYLSFWR